MLLTCWSRSKGHVGKRSKETQNVRTSKKKCVLVPIVNKNMTMYISNNIFFIKLLYQWIVNIENMLHAFVREFDNDFSKTKIESQ